MNNCLSASHSGFSQPYVIMACRNINLAHDLSPYTFNSNNYLPTFQYTLEKNILKLDSNSLDLCRLYIKEHLFLIGPTFLLTLLDKLDRLIYDREE